MNQEERTLIRGLFEKLSRVGASAGPRDPEAEAFIRQEIDAEPGAPYYMAQTIIMQEKALEAAQARIAELERKPAATSDAPRPGTFSGAWGGQPRAPSRPIHDDGYGGHGGRTSVPTVGQRSGFGGGFGGGGFLAGAAQTAMGVAGGVLLGNMLADMFDGNDGTETAAADTGDGANAGADTAADSGADAGAADTAGFQEADYSDPGLDDGGFDMGEDI
ncbi:DUF2076 family protein [Chthonobacter rhizosphaerae]|uniref:DUF2076 family protein n=1 Tax=Chthonobacter rhizosphaerae TaxID=2735553 RepID=UPI0015EFC756